jgi:hypothetical protein
MNIADPVPVAVEDRQQLGYIQWGPAIAGALAAAALVLVLDTFALAIGLAVSSTAPTWRDSSMALQLLSGLYLVLVAIVAFGVGGYIAGRLRAPLPGTPEEVEFRDGTHGIVVWAIAMVLGALLTWGAAQSLTRLAAPSAGSPATAQSVAGENLIAFDLDRLFRAERRPQNADLSYARSDAARILLTSAGHDGMTADDRAYLVRLTTSHTGLAPQDAENRVNTVIAQAADEIRKARRASVILAFMAGAASLLGAAVAWFAACAGGRHRDSQSGPSMSWGWLGPRVVS